MSDYKHVTDLVLAKLKQGVVQWHRPWNDHDHPRNLASGRRYRGINVFLLLGAGYEQPYWLTGACAIKKGGRVRQGEKPRFVVGFFAGTARKQQGADPTAVPVLKSYEVYNLAQCEGIATPRRRRQKARPDPIARCAEVMDKMPLPPKIQHGGDAASYNPSLDRVRLPPLACFDSAEEYYSTAFHELGHATGHESRLRRRGITALAGFGDTQYAREELVAEMAAVFLCSEAGIEMRTLDNSAAYLDSWMQRLRRDPRCLVIAATQAQTAVDWVMGRYVRKGQNGLADGKTRG